MALPRANLAASIAGELAEVLGLAGLGTTDVSSALKEPLDRAFRAMGVAELSLPTASAADGQEARALAYATYFTLDRALAALVGKMNVASAGARADLHQQFENVQAQRDRALMVARTYGLTQIGPANPQIAAGGIDRTSYDTVAANRLRPFFTVRHG